MRSIVVRQREIPSPFEHTPNVPDLLKRIYAARGIISEQQLSLDVANLLTPSLMGGMEQAVQVVLDAILTQKHITIAGDYDCDGATGSTVAVRGLRMLGAKNVRFVIPDRFKHGYGLSPGLVDAMDPETQLIITVDSGVSSIEGVNHAKSLGRQVVITDHHLPGETLPDADAIINPNLKGDPFPSKALAGVGVMFYLLIAIRAEMRKRGLFEGATEPNLAELLDIVAIGTIADLVTLDQNNRMLVSAGLRRIRTRKGHAGVYALLEMANKESTSITATDIAFGIAPRLNAAGRLKDMTLGVETLITDNPGVAWENAVRLDKINNERKEKQAEMTELAEKMVFSNDSYGAKGVVVYDPSWHSGIVGLVASKLKEAVHRPVFAFAPAEKGSKELRGSGRSIPGFHLRDALALIDSRYPGLIPKFGGHAMAAGMSLHADRIEDFVKAFDTIAEELLTDEHLIQAVYTDGELAVGQITLDTAHLLRQAGPWGQGFPEPIFENTFYVKDFKTLGSEGNHLKMELIDPRDGVTVEAIQFFSPNIPPPKHVRICYEVDINKYRDNERLQLLVRHLTPVEETAS